MASLSWKGLIPLLSYVERTKTTLEQKCFLQHRTALDRKALLRYFLFINARKTRTAWELSGMETSCFLLSLRKCLSLYDFYTLFLLMLPNKAFSKFSHDVVRYHSKYRTGTKFVSFTAFFSFIRPKSHLKFPSKTQPY
jgi:hypothetical protein